MSSPLPPRPPPPRNVLSPPPPPPQPLSARDSVASPPQIRSPSPMASPSGNLSPHQTDSRQLSRDYDEGYEDTPAAYSSSPKPHGVSQTNPAISSAVSPSMPHYSERDNTSAVAGSEISLDRISPLIERISEKYLAAQLVEKKRNDELQLNAINATLKKWADQISTEMKKSQSSQSSGVEKAAAILDSAVGDSRDRQLKIVDEIKEAHKKQLDILRQAMAEERQLAQQAQQVFEETLQTKYDSMVSALQVKIRAEQEASMQRALSDLEKSARAEGERARQAFEVQQAAEAAIAAKFKSIVGDLRRSWEEEESSRAKQLEERLRGHYSGVLEHMEAQLQMALQLQDDADRQWMEDVEARNRQQVSTIKAFEEKCRRLYDTRLAEYAERTDQQLSRYEDQLLEAGGALVTERSKFDSRQRRLKIACHRWKIDYQREVHAKYQESISVMEEKYMSEITRLLEELSFARNSTSQVMASVESKERDIIRDKLKVKVGEASTAANNNGVDPYAETPATQSKKRALREELTQRWQDLGTPVEERVLLLASLLDAAPLTPALTTKYEAVLAKLGARMPIMQMLSRKQYIEYKLRLTQRPGAGPSSDTLSAPARAELTQELQDLTASIENATKQYEIRYSERFVRPPNILQTAASSSASPIAANMSPMPNNGAFSSAFSSAGSVSSIKGRR